MTKSLEHLTAAPLGLLLRQVDEFLQLQSLKVLRQLQVVHIYCI